MGATLVEWSVPGEEQAVAEPLPQTCSEATGLLHCVRLVPVPAPRAMVADNAPAPGPARSEPTSGRRVELVAWPRVPRRLRLLRPGSPPRGRARGPQPRRRTLFSCVVWGLREGG